MKLGTFCMPVMSPTKEYSLARSPVVFNKASHSWGLYVSQGLLLKTQRWLIVKNFSKHDIHQRVCMQEPPKAERPSSTHTQIAHNLLCTNRNNHQQHNTRSPPFRFALDTFTQASLPPSSVGIPSQCYALDHFQLLNLRSPPLFITARSPGSTYEEHMHRLIEVEERSYKHPAEARQLGVSPPLPRAQFRALG